jgi:hypothetical protein
MAKQNRHQPPDPELLKLVNKHQHQTQSGFNDQNPRWFETPNKTTAEICDFINIDGSS